MKRNNGKIVSMGTGLHKSVSNAEISTKDYVLFYAVLYWKRVQFLESHQFW
jgi:hypothetical protein